MPEFFSVDGIEIFITELRKINDTIALNMVNKSFTRHREFQRVLEELNYHLFVILQDVTVAEWQIAHKSLFDFAPQAKSIPSFEALTASLL